MTLADDDRRTLRQTIYAILITVSTGMMLGRILAVDSVDFQLLERWRFQAIPGQVAERQKQMEAKGWSPEAVRKGLQRYEAELTRRASISRPFLSANDRSRWDTLRALVEPEMRVYREVRAGGKVYRQWVPYAIDKVVVLPGWDTIDMVKHRLRDDPAGPGYLYSSKPTLLPTLMAVPYWIIYHTTGATLGTRTYEIARTLLVLLNVVPLVIAFVLLARLVDRFGTTDWARIFVMAAAVFGTFLSTFAVVLNNHLPGAASAMVALYAAVRIWFDGERRLRYFLVAGLFGSLAVACELPALSFFALLSLALVWKAPRPTLLGYVPIAALVAAGAFGTNWIAHQDLRPPYAHQKEGDNWYDYTYQRDGRTYQSYWSNRVGIDRGEKSLPSYVLHTTIGHHGIFSLSPIWLLSIAGLALWLRRPADRRLRQLALFVAVISAVCFYFYVFMQPLGNRNYGGMSSGFRWMFWFAPMWLVVMLPAADALSRRRSTRALALVLLAVSVLSVSYPTWNPWTHPWLLNYLHYLGWVRV